MLARRSPIVRLNFDDRCDRSIRSLSSDLVEGEQRYWVRVAIDRFTGQVIDRSIEVVNQ